MASAPTLSVNVALEDPEHPDPVLKRLRAAGFKVGQVLREIGVVTGSVASEHVDRLRQIAGVAGVEPSRDFQLPPPDSDVQ